MLQHRILGCSFVLSLLLLATNLAWADADVGKPSTHWRICIGDRAVRPYINNDPARLGVGERLLIDAGAQAGLSIELMRYPTRRCRQQLLLGKLEGWVAAPTPGNQADATFPQRAGLVDASRRLASLNMVWVQRRESTLTWDGKTWLGSAPNDLLIGVRAGQNSAIEPLKKMGFRVDDAAFNVPQLFRKLLAKRIDLVLALQEEVHSALLGADAQPHLIHVWPEPLFSLDFHVSIGKHLSPERHAQAEALWNAIGDLREREKYRP